MPRRVWVSLGAMVVTLGAVVAALLIFGSDGNPDPIAPTVAEAETPGIDETLPANPVAAAPEPVAIAPPVMLPGGAPVPAAGVDGVVRLDRPVEIDATPLDDAGFQAELVAYAAGQQDRLPETDDIATLESVETIGRQVIFTYTIAISLRDYTLPLDPTPLLPDITGWLCDGSVCFEFHDTFIRARCDSDLGPLIDRGAIAVFIYRDAEGLPIGTLPIDAAACATT
ncbi:MAG: hypothetical protein AB7O56_10960 [Bauldia sp.]